MAEAEIYRAERERQRTLQAQHQAEQERLEKETALQKAEEERQRTLQAQEQAEAERQRAELERQRAEKLAAKLRELKIDLDEP